MWCTSRRAHAADGDLLPQPVMTTHTGIPRWPPGTETVAGVAGASPVSLGERTARLPDPPPALPASLAEKR